MIFLLPHPSSREAYARGKKEKPPFLPEEPSSSSGDPIPDELLCLICKDTMTDAVVTPCCGNGYCDDCKWLLIQNITSDLLKAEIRDNEITLFPVLVNTEVYPE